MYMFVSERGGVGWTTPKHLRYSILGKGGFKARVEMGVRVTQVM